ncbi:MAG: hypothetical protein ABR600_00685 [Actinomycetota bacterium]
MAISSGPTILLPVPISPVVPDTTVPLATAVVVFVSPGAGGYWMTTKGLGEWGLPELQTLRVHGEVVQPWCWVMTGAGLALTEHWLDVLAGDPPPFVDIPASVEVTPAHIDRAYGKVADARDGAVRLRLRLDPATDPDTDSFLTIGPPRGSGPRRAFMYDACVTLFGDPDYVDQAAE